MKVTMKGLQLEGMSHAISETILFSRMEAFVHRFDKCSGSPTYMDSSAQLMHHSHKHIE